MRFVRVTLGLLLALPGLLVTTAGAAAAFWLVGPDDIVDTGEQRLTSRGLAVMTAPDLLDRHGPTLRVTAENAAGETPVFVGVGRELDVADYLGEARHTRVVRLAVPTKLETQEAKGGTGRLNPPAGLDWWTTRASGPGSRSISWPIEDGRYDVVVMNADGSPAIDAKVTFGVELEGAFVTCLLVLLGGLVLLVVGLVLILVRSRPLVPAPFAPAAQFAPAARFAPPAYQGLGQGTVRRTAGVVTGLAVLAATGCVAVPQQNTQPRSSGRAAVTVADGRAVVKRYTEVSNKANQRRDELLARTVESGPVLAQTRAGFSIGKVVDAAGKEKVAPFTYTRPEIGATQYSAYPMRFVVTAGVSTDRDTRLLGVWERKNAGAPWMLSHAVHPAAGTGLPAMDGLRTPARPDLEGLSVPPNAAAQDLAQYLTDGTKSSRAAGFAPSPGVTGLFDSRAAEKAADAKKSYVATSSDTFRVAGEPVTFLTGSGEALVLLTLSERHLKRIAPNSTASWSSGDVVAFSNRVSYTRALTRDRLHQAALIIPPKGKGKVRVLSVDGQVVGAGGY